MMNCDDGALDHMEKNFPGIRKTIFEFENAMLPLCSHCGSADTADVQVGVIGRTIHIAGATTKFKLIPNGPRPGRYFCHACDKFFDQPAQGPAQLR